MMREETFDSVREWTAEEFFPKIKRENNKGYRASMKECLIYSRWMRITYVIILCFSVGLFAPWIINTYMSFAPKDPRVAGTCHIQIGVRTNCFPDRQDPDDVTEDECIERHCCYQRLNLQNGGPVCHRKIPSVHTLNITEAKPHNKTDGFLVPAYSEISRVWPELAPENLQYKIRQLAPGHVSVLLFDGDRKPEVDIGNDEFVTSDVDWSLQSEKDSRLSLRFWRNSSLSPLIDASHGSVFVTKNYSEISLLLPSGVFYGLGGHPISFNHTASYFSTNFTKKLFFNLDSEVAPEQQHSLPIFMTKENGNVFAIYLETEGAALEVEVMPGLFIDGTYEPSLNQTVIAQKPLVVFRSMSDFLLLHLFVGPTPKDIMRQITQYLGRPSLPSVHSLGLQVCRKMNTSSADLLAFEENLRLMKNFKIPFDTDCVSENLLKTSFELNTNYDVDNLLTRLNEEGKKFVLAMPPHVAYTSDLSSDKRFIQNDFGNETFVADFGQSGTVVLPDFTNSTTEKWFTEQLKTLLGYVDKSPPVGISLIQNSPHLKLKEDCRLNDFAFLPNFKYYNQTIIGLQTVCPESTQAAGKHFNLHNSYARSHVATVHNSLITLNKQSAGISSTHSYPGGMQTLMGSDRATTWENLGSSLREVLEFGISGSGFVSMQACGFDRKSFAMINSTVDLDELCLRWYQLSAFMPALHAKHTENSNSSMPYGFSRTTFTNWIRRALQRRIKLAPYMYTQMYSSLQDDSLNTGVPLVRPLMMEFPDDVRLNNNHIIWKQFMFGEAIMVTPIIDPEIRLLESFFPRSNWFEIWSGIKIQGLSQKIKTEAIQAQIPAYIRAGHIVPLLAFNESDYPLSTWDAFSRSSHSLIVGLACPELDPKIEFGSNCSAKGSLLAHFDGSDNPKFEEFALISISASHVGGKATLTLGDQALTWVGCSAPTHADIITVVVYGANKPLDLPPNSYTYDEDLMRLQITSNLLNWCNSQQLQLQWTFEE